MENKPKTNEEIIAKYRVYVGLQHNREELNELLNEARAATFAECKAILLKLFDRADDTVWLTEHETFMDGLINEGILTREEFEAWCKKHEDMPDQLSSLTKRDKMPTQRKDLILTKDTVIDGDLIATNITGKNGERYNLTVRGDINALNIDAHDINALNIDAHDINALNINAVNIDAGDINAVNIDAYDINAYNINAYNIDAHNIDAHNIDAYDIKARAIDACFILCESIKQKEGSKLLAKNIITKRSGYEQKEMKLKE